MNKELAIQNRKREIITLLENKEIQERFTSLLGSEKQKETFKANLLNIAMDSNLAQCSSQSIIKAALNVASLKLSLSKSLGKAYIVPRNKRVGNEYITEAHIDIGYKGWLELAKKSKLSIHAYLVFDCDTFSYKIVNNNEIVEFIPNYDVRQEHDYNWIKERLKGAYVMIKDMKHNDYNNRFVTKETLFKIMQNSDSVKKNKYSAYTDWLGEMLLAKAIKYTVSKTAMSEEIGMAVSFDNENEQDFHTLQNNAKQIQTINKLNNLLQSKANNSNQMNTDENINTNLFEIEEVEYVTEPQQQYI